MNFISQRQCVRLITGSVLVLALVALALPALAGSLSGGSLSGWLNTQVVPELGRLFSSHPRYQGQRIQIVGGNDNGLSEAIGHVLNSKLAGRGDIALIAPGQAGIATKKLGSIDQLSCVDTDESDYLLQVTTGLGEPAGGRVHIVLMDLSAGAEQVRQWQWQGAFSTAERQQYAKPLTTANGSLSAPWHDRDIEAAGAALSRDFACALRPQIHHSLALQWLQESGLPAVFSDTANIARHKLGNFRELGISDVQGDYAVAIRLERLRGDLWQLWLTGTPHRKTLAPVQAVTYFQSASPTIVAQPGPAIDFIDVQMVDATQADKGRSRADLQVTLRLSNRAQQPIAYSFMLSGGHFEQCIAEPGYYRHDDYGLLAGELAGGASVLRRLVIENAEHRPAPLYGVPKCAGFRDLQGFQEFASQGYKVTEYVRWAM